MRDFDDVDAYLAASEQWPAEVAALREVLLGCDLDESIKWGKPCYSLDGSNIALMQEMKNFLALMFFKGSLLDDPEGVLHDQGPNSRAAKRMQFTSVDDVRRLAEVVPVYVEQAIDVERQGLEVEPAPEPEMVEELQRRLDADPDLAEAFAALTPGRRREYHLYFSSAKQASTRESRVEKYVPKILAGKGFRDR
ncbi:MAG: hypothetical protein CL424_20715 [Acidimicrobiaceae bacterium]|nr:hypothetical protein [Acidimicrobiaceae bacterium]